MELKEGMYIRYVPTLGEYTQKISKITKTKNCMLDMCYTLDDKEEVFSSHFDEIIKASYNIIDLIEVGDILIIKDFVDEACMIFTDIYLIQNETQLLNLKNDLEKNKNKILYQIATKEQFSQISYNLKGEQK